MTGTFGLSHLDFLVFHTRINPSPGLVSNFLLGLKDMGLYGILLKLQSLVGLFGFKTSGLGNGIRFGIIEGGWAELLSVAKSFSRYGRFRIGE